MSNTSFTAQVSNVMTLVIGVAFFAITTVGLVSPASALASTTAIAHTVAR